MLKNKVLPTMIILNGILLITILLSESKVDAVKLKKYKTDDQVFVRKRSTTGKCTEVLTGYYYSGDVGPQVLNVKTSGDCQNLCSQDSQCYGWQYQTTSNYCWHQTTIGIKYIDASYKGGSCIGPAAKQNPCTEVKNGMYYNGDSGSAIPNVASVKACQSKCNADSTCVGWSYQSSASKCWTQTSIRDPVNSAQYTGGSCVIQQPPYPAISIGDFQQQALDAVNAYRNKHGAPPLTLSSDLNNIAQNYAEKLAETKTFAHSGNTYDGNYLGECLWENTGSSGPLYTAGSAPAASWYNEIKDYNWSNQGFSASTGHFTQLVWSGSQIVGFGRALSSDNSSLYVVANFYPGGNIVGAYTENVLPPS